MPAAPTTSGTAANITITSTANVNVFEVGGNPVYQGANAGQQAVAIGDATTTNKLVVDSNGSAHAVLEGPDGNPLMPTAALVADGSANPTTTQVEALLGGYIGSSTFNLVRLPVLTKGVSASASGSTALWTPTSGKKFRVLRGLVQLGGDASLSVAGAFTLQLKDSATNIPGAKWNFYLPAAVTPGMLGVIQFDFGNGILSAAANNVLNASLSIALNTGTIQVQVIGVEE